MSKTLYYHIKVEDFRPMKAECYTTYIGTDPDRVKQGDPDYLSRAYKRATHDVDDIHAEYQGMGYTRID